MNTTANDTRNISTGLPIPCETYCDQPYIVQTADRAWLCVMTTAGGEEGADGQHVVSVRSRNWGRTWDAPVAIEPVGPPEASYVTALQTPEGRVYAFYNHNTDNIRTVQGEINGVAYDETRVDSLGYFVFKYSDDYGETWSPERYRIPVRPTRIDRDNVYNGVIRFFWHVGRPLIHDGAAYVTHHKIGAFGDGFMAESEGWFLRSANLLTEREPEKITWETLPDGDVGLRAPEGGRVSDEQSVVALSDGSLFCVNRTIQGHPCHAYSRDNGRTWTPPAFMTFGGPNARLVKHPRAATFVWKTREGKYLCWFHNHGGTYYDARNPAWLSGGREADGPDGKVLLWSEPEIALYDDDTGVRMSYPDLVETPDGAFYLTETQKTVARVHKPGPGLLEGLWAQHENNAVAQNGLVREWNAADLAGGATVAMPFLPRLWRGGGFSFDFTVRAADTLAATRTLLDARDAAGRGVCLTLSPHGEIVLSLAGTVWSAAQMREGNGLTESVWRSDRGRITPAAAHHVTVTVDGGPKIITFVIDGALCDGGTDRSCGWGRFHPGLDDVNGGESALVTPQGGGVTLGVLRVYDRFLRTSEAVGNYRAGSAG